MTVKEKIYNYFKVSPQLRVLFVFDPMGMQKNEIDMDQSPWPDDYVFHIFEGDWFGVKVHLNEDWADKKVVLLFDGRYNEPNRKNQESCLKFPLLGTLEANMVFREEDEDAFMDQRHIPAQYSDFVRRHISELLRDKYDKIFKPYYGTIEFSQDLAYRALISVYMDMDQLQEWPQIVARLIIMCAGNEKKKLNFFNRLTGQATARHHDVADALSDKLTELCGQTFNLNSEEKVKEVAEALKYNAITQKLVADPNDPYKAYKIDDIVRQRKMNKLLSDIRENKRLYDAFLPAFEQLSQNVKEEVIIQVYGTDVDYAWHSEAMCRPIIATVVRDSLVTAPDTVIDRLTSLKEDLNENSNLFHKLQFCLLSANYYKERNKVVNLRLNTPDLYVEHYTREWYLIDQYYRKVVMSYTGLSIEENTSAMEKIKKAIDRNYADFANQMNLEWLNCVKEFGQGLRSVKNIPTQSSFYEANIKNHPYKVAVIVSDALRYELADELISRLQGKKHIATLDAAMAMLPTETKYCKPTLLPHQSLRFANNDLEVDGKVLGSTAERTKHLQNFENNAICIGYKELMDMGRDERSKVFNHSLTYVFHNTIDDMGHGCTAKGFSDGCKTALDELASLIPFIHDRGNVTEVYITSDHGFLYNDQTFEEKDKHKVNDPILENTSRYYITTSIEDKAGITKFTLRDVSAMESDEYVAVPTGTNRLYAVGGDYEFVHGGASLEELIIPVVFSKYKREQEKEKVGVELRESSLFIVSSRMKAHIVQKEPVSMDKLKRTVVCGLYQNDHPVVPEITKELDCTSDSLDLRTYELDFNVTTGNGVYQFKVADINDRMNPLICQNVINNTLIERDEF